MKKKVISIALVIALIAVIAVGSFAYFTDTKSATNTFTLGDVKIKLDETNVADPEGDRVTANTYDVYPGAVVTKDPVVHNVGKNAAFIRATINVENWMNFCATYYPEYNVHYPEAGYEQSLMLLVDALGEGWSIEGVTTGTPFTMGNFSAQFILKYEGTLASGADTAAMFNEVKIPTTLHNGSEFGAITVTAQAIQADGFDTWEDAFAAFDAQK